jgi:hypothetical protein
VLPFQRTAAPAPLVLAPKIHTFRAPEDATCGYTEDENDLAPTGYDACHADPSQCAATRPFPVLRTPAAHAFPGLVTATLVNWPPLPRVGW